MAIQWISSRSYTNDYEDVEIMECKGISKHYIRIVFRGEFTKHIKESRYIRLGFDKKRIYFDLRDKDCDGTFKASNYSSAAFSLQIPERYVSALKEFVGSYSLKINDDNLWFIEKEN